MRIFLIIILSFFYLFSLAQNKNDSIKNGELLCKYSSEGKLDSVIFLIKQGVNLNYRSSDRITALLYAVDGNHTDIVKVLVHNGADPNYLPFNNYTALMNSTYLGNFEIAHYLAKNNAKINQRDNLGATALHYAVLKGRYFIADMLLFYGANPNIKTNEGNSASMIAAFFEDTIMLNILLKNNVDLNLVNEKGISALDISAQYNNQISFKLLLDSGAAPFYDSAKYSSLTYSLLSNNDSLVLLLADRCSPEHFDRNDYKSPVNMALILGERNLAKELKIKGYKPKKGFLNSNTILLFDFNFNGDDFIQKIKIGLDDVKYGFFYGIGSSFRYKRKNILIDRQHNNFYLAKEFRFFFDAFVGNQLKLFDYQNIEFGLYSLLETQFSIGNYKGLAMKPEQKLYFNPYIGLYLEYDVAFLAFTYSYNKYDYYSISNNRFNISIGFKLSNVYTPTRYEASLLEFL